MPTNNPQLAYHKGKLAGLVKAKKMFDFTESGIADFNAKLNSAIALERKNVKKHTTTKSCLREAADGTA